MFSSETIESFTAFHLRFVINVVRGSKLNATWIQDWEQILIIDKIREAENDSNEEFEKVNYGNAFC